VDAKQIFTHGGKPREVDDDQEIMQKAGICVAMQTKGRELKKQLIDDPTECFPMLENSRVAWVSFGIKDIFENGAEVAQKLGFGEELTKRLLSDDQSHYYDFENELGLRLPVVHIDGLDVRVVPLAIFMRKGLIVTIHEKSSPRLLKLARYVDGFMRKLPSDLTKRDQMTVLLTRIIDENTDRNFDYLRSIEEKADQLSARLVREDVDRRDIGENIYQLKHALIVFLDTLWATLDVVQTLRYGDPDVISDRKEILEQITVVADQINRQIQLSEHMSEVLVSGLEVMQSIYNNQLQELNNKTSLTMTWLTVIGTALLVPNTIATIFGVSAFELTRSDIGWYVWTLIISTVVATGAAYWWVTRRANIESVARKEQKRNKKE
jgi:magnesium transporter